MCWKHCNHWGKSRRNQKSSLTSKEKINKACHVSEKIVQRLCARQSPELPENLCEICAQECAEIVQNFVRGCSCTIILHICPRKDSSFSMEVTKIREETAFELSSATLPLCCCPNPEHDWAYHRKVFFWSFRPWIADVEGIWNLDRVSLLLVFATDQRKAKGEGETQGRGKHTINPSPKTVLDPPTHDTIPPPPLCSRNVILLRGNGHRPDKSHFLRPPKLGLTWESQVWGDFCESLRRYQNRVFSANRFARVARRFATPPKPRGYFKICLSHEGAPQVCLERWQNAGARKTPFLPSLENGISSPKIPIPSRLSFPATEPPDPRRVSEGVSERVSEGFSFEGSWKGFRRVSEGISWGPF